MWLLLIVVLLLLLSLYLYKLNEKYYVLALCKRITLEDGTKLEDKIYVVPGAFKLFGNNFDLLDLTPATIFNYARRCNALSKGKSYVLYFLRAAIYSITTAEDAAELFQSTALLEKSVIYDLLRPFLGDGLLISSDRKWHSRRKMLTPAFHFNVLQSFNEVFKEESLKLLKRLENLQQDQIDVNDIITEFTLNNVIETALGVKLDDMSGSAQYRKKIHDIELIFLERIYNPLLVFDCIFKWFGKHEQHQRDVAIAHDFSSKIIKKKREEYQQSKTVKQDIDKESDIYGKKKRYAMLDTLLDEEAKGNIDHAGICEEVDTFMFEGYDTTSTCLIFTILNLALNEDAQEKCRQEIEHLGDFSSLTVFDFNQLDYLECVLKETLRLYPSVPFLARTCVNETRINGFILPPGTQINVHTYDIMRDPRHFPEPNVFKPERFSQQNSVNRHPFAFVPFSAGSRNCIGQKFAILEMKAVLVALLRNFRILPITKMEDLVFENGLILRTQQRVYVKLTKIRH